MRRNLLLGSVVFAWACAAAPIEVDEPEVRALGSTCGALGVQACEDACREGDGPACMVAAHAYENGKRVRVDRDRMAELEAAACAGDVALGCYFHSSNRELPPGVRHRSASRACALGHAKACGRAVNLGAGLVAAGEAKVEILSVSLERGCELDPRQCAGLAGLLRLGLGLAKDEARAQTLEQRACEGGSDFACRQLEDDARIWVSLPQSLFFSRKHAPITPMQFEPGVEPAAGVEIVFRAAACFEGSPKPTLTPLESSISPDFDAAILEDSQRWHFTFGPLYPQAEALCFLEEYRVKPQEWRAR